MPPRTGAASCVIDKVGIWKLSKIAQRDREDLVYIQRVSGSASSFKRDNIYSF